jgi:hypothetical protein
MALWYNAFLSLLCLVRTWSGFGSRLTIGLEREMSQMTSARSWCHSGKVLLCLPSSIGL